jgi:hypothetical protein
MGSVQERKKAKRKRRRNEEKEKTTDQIMDYAYPCTLKMQDCSRNIYPSEGRKDSDI